MPRTFRGTQHPPAPIRIAFHTQAVYKTGVPLRHAVLGLILERRGYGYDLAQRLTGRLGPAWQLNPSAVYSALDQLERDRHIVGSLREVAHARSDHLARRPGRVVYDATPAGRDAFRAWLEHATRGPEPVRNELHMKIAVAGPSDMPSLISAMEHEESLARHLLDRTTERGDDVRSELVRSAARARVKAELDWIRTARATLAQEH